MLRKTLKAVLVALFITAFAQGVSGGTKFQEVARKPAEVTTTLTL